MSESKVCSSDKAETEIIALKEALQTQQQHLQNLYIELEEEREASATATSEALSMILRLQGERAVEKMEASQYKRMSEEKMHYTEESIGMFEELMYQKEMEIASLEFQVQAYRYKLLSMGFSYSAIAEMRLPENPFLERNEAQFGDLGVYGTVRRNNSLPAIRFKKVTIERGSGVLPVELYPKEICENLNREFDVQTEGMQKCSEESAVGGLNSYREQIKQLDERVKEFSHGKDIDRGAESDWVSSSQGPRPTIAVYSAEMVCSSAKTDLLYEPIKGSICTNLDHEGAFSCSSSQAEDPDNLFGPEASSSLCTRREATRNATCSISVHDVFEVPENHENNEICESQKQDQDKVILEGKSRLDKPHSIPQRTVEHYFEDEAERVKKVLYSPLDNKLSKQRDGVTADCHLHLVEPTVSVAPSQAGVKTLNKQLKKVEGERIAKQIVSDREEEIRLLREIHEKLDSIQSDIKSSRVDSIYSEIKSSRATKHPPLDEFLLVSVMEAMLLYSL